MGVEKKEGDPNFFEDDGFVPDKKSSGISDNLRSAADKAAKAAGKLGDEIMDRTAGARKVIADTSEKVGEKVLDVSEQVGEKVMDVSERVGEKVIDTAEDIGSKLFDKAKSFADKATEQAESLLKRRKRKLQKNLWMR